MAELVCFCADCSLGTNFEFILHTCCAGTTAEQLCLSERYVYALNAAGEVLMRYGVVHDNPGGNYWKKVPGALKQMTGGFVGLLDEQCDSSNRYGQGPKDQA